MITKERRQALLGHFNAQNPEEREFVREALAGFPWRETEQRPKDDNDYEGAILARAEQDYPSI